MLADRLAEEVDSFVLFAIHLVRHVLDGLVLGAPRLALAIREDIGSSTVNGNLLARCVAQDLGDGGSLVDGASDSGDSK